MTTPFIDTTKKWPESGSVSQRPKGNGLTDQPESPNPDKPKPVTFRSPAEFMEWEPSDGFLLFGEPDKKLSYLARGGIAVLSGHPGTFKSRASVYVAIQAALGEPKALGIPLASQFKTMILQSENGHYRFNQEFNSLADKLFATREEAIRTFDEWIRVSEVPPCGIDLQEPGFISELKKQIEMFEPGLLVIDPWNACFTGEGNQKDYSDALRSILSCLPTDPEKRPGVLIIAHVRKKNGNNKPYGRDMLHEISGSLKLGSQARTVFVMDHVSTDQDIQEVVIFNPKANDAPTLPPAAFETESGKFQSVEFDCEIYCNDSAPGERKRKVVEPSDIELALGEDSLRQKAIVDRVIDRAREDGRKIPGESTVKTLIGELKKDGKLTTDQEGFISWSA